MSQKNVLFVVASSGYQSVEYDIPKKLLEQAGITVVTASDRAGIATAQDDSSTPVDLLINNADIANYDGIVFIGGPGALEHLNNQTSYKLLQNADEERKIIGAICASTRILAQAGILNKKQATGWDSDNQLSEIYQKNAVFYVKQDIVVDENIITAIGPRAAREFGERLITMLQD